MLMASGEIPVADFPRYPGHTQAAEQTVKLVTEASASVCGEKGWIYSCPIGVPQNNART
jgi:hypothetical protein